jgi:hypothetical protein
MRLCGVLCRSIIAQPAQRPTRVGRLIIPARVTPERTRRQHAHVDFVSLVLLGLAAAVYPTLLAGVILILTQPNPLQMLVAFLVGGMAIGDPGNGLSARNGSTHWESASARVASL